MECLRPHRNGCSEEHIEVPESDIGDDREAVKRLSSHTSADLEFSAEICKSGGEKLANHIHQIITELDWTNVN